MNASLVCLLTAIAITPQWTPGTEYRLEGELAAAKSDTPDSLKRFQLSLFTDKQAGAAGQTIYWALTENGRGQAPWVERFGSWDIKSGVTGDDGPALFYQREDGLSIRALPAAALATDTPWKVGAKWSEGKRDFEVVGETKLNDVDCWKINSTDRVSRRRNMVVDKATGIVFKLEENLFLGRGVPFVLKWRIMPVAGSSKHVMAAAEATRRLVELREQAGRQRRDDSQTLTKQQRDVFIKSLAPIATIAKDSPIETVLNAAKRDILSQARREDSVASMRGRAIGRDVSSAKLNSIDGDEVKVSNGQVTVLHFWEYREKPLKEPYGQSAYVDFLHRNRSKDEVNVVGLNVDTRLGINATRSAAIRSAKRFRDLMNLSYPLLLDDGTLLRRIGDPRSTGAKLPLYVVLDRKGRVVEYKAGLYEVDRRAGLKQLDAIVTKALGNSE